jgi:hypothetical protein
MLMAVEIFFCYAREDEELRKGLEKQLRALKRQGIIDIWYDRAISAGAEWEREIDRHLNSAKIILLLVSPDFMDSDYCYSQEMLRAMERHERGDARVIPVILRPVYWQGAPFGKLQALPTDAKAITSRDWHHLDEAFFDVAEGIRKVVLELSELSCTESIPTKDSNPSILNVQMVINAWESVRKRAKQKSTSGLVAAYLGHYKVLGIEGTAEQPIVVIQAAKQVHHDYVKANDRYKDLEWALTMEFGTSCRVRLVPPDMLLQTQVRMEMERETVPTKDGSGPTLTVQQVNNAWENIRKRIKQKSKSGLTAAYLGHYQVIDIEGTTERPIVVIQAAKQVHHDYVKANDRYKDLEWALTMEFGSECRVRLVPPESSSNNSLL